MVQLSSLISLLPSFSVNILCDLLDGAGLATDTILQDAGLHRGDLFDGELLITGAQEYAVQHGFAMASADQPDLWIEAGRRYRIYAYYPVGFAQATAASLDIALRLPRRFTSLHYSLGTFETLSDNDGNVGIAIHYPPSLHELADYLRCRDTIAQTNWFHDIAGRDFPFTRIECSSPLALNFDFRAEVVVAAPVSRWWWRRDLMTMAPAAADPVLHRMWLGLCERLTTAVRIGETQRPSWYDNDTLVTRIVAVIENADRMDVSLGRTAAVLSMTARTLQRHLSKRNLTFRELTDAVRFRAAQRLLAADGRPIAEIAWQLGYVDTSSFYQAFARWAQMSPSRFRQLRRAGNTRTRPIGQD